MTVQQMQNFTPSSYLFRHYKLCHQEALLPELQINDCFEVCYVETIREDEMAEREIKRKALDVLYAKWYDKVRPEIECFWKPKKI